MNHPTPFALLLCAALAACGGAATGPANDAVADAEPRGPNNGRLLVDGDFALELAIFETGVPPEYRAWASMNGEPVPPGELDLEVRLTRLGDEVDVIEFVPEGDFLRGTSIVYEPHSFTVTVAARHQGRQHRWQYDSFEGRTRISPEMAEAFGLATMTAGPAVLRETLTLYGRIVPAADRVREVRARFDGAIRSVDITVGDIVRAGQTLATIESNESLRPYTIVAPIAGIVTERVANPGEQTAARRLFTILDTSLVWAELAVFLGDRERVRIGAPVTITATLGGATVESAIAYVAPFIGANQAVTARAVLDNADGRWVLGAHVAGRVRIAETEVPLAVKRSALQSFRDFTVVFAQIGDEYEVRMLELGRQDPEWAEVLGGLAAGTRYVTEKSYVLKADVEKAGATHDH